MPDCTLLTNYLSASPLTQNLVERREEDRVVEQREQKWTQSQQLRTGRPVELRCPVSRPGFGWSPSTFGESNLHASDLWALRLDWDVLELLRAARSLHG